MECWIKAASVLQKRSIYLIEISDNQWAHFTDWAIWQAESYL